MSRLGVALLLLLAGCGKGALPEPARAYTMFDIAAAYQANENVLVGVEGAPDGLPASLFVKGPEPTIPIQPAFAEGGFSPYITTNLWANFPEVWVQPMYIFVTKWDPSTQRGAPVPTQPWIYTVAPGSRFHSPFWRVYWVELPDPLPRPKYTSSAQIFADKLVMHEGPGHLVSLVPLGTKIASLDAAGGQYAGHMTTMPTVRTQDFLDGQSIGAVDFGENRFTWNDDLEVTEQPFFVFFSCPAGGTCQMAGVPNVGGTGPLFTRTPAIAPNNRPLFGSFWRLYFVTLPNSDALRVFVPPGDPYDAVRDTIAMNLKVATGTLGFTPDPAKVGDVNRHFMQVAFNGATCFADAASFDQCQWLDSQQAVEEHLPNAIVRSGITVTCPFVAYDDQKVPPK
jgi:hypothetical protein